MVMITLYEFTKQFQAVEVLGLLGIVTSHAHCLA